MCISRGTICVLSFDQLSRYAQAEINYDLIRQRTAINYHVPLFSLTKAFQVFLHEGQELVLVAVSLTYVNHTTFPTPHP